MNNDYDKSPKSFVYSNKSKSRKVSCNANESDQGEGLNSRSQFEMINLPERVWSMNHNKLKAKTLMRNQNR